MKKIIGLPMLALLFTMVACNDKPAEVKKEVIIVPAAPSVIVVKDPPEKGTTITFDKNGVKVVTKKVDIKVNKQ